MILILFLPRLSAGDQLQRGVEVEELVAQLQLLHLERSDHTLLQTMHRVHVLAAVNCLAQILLGHLSLVIHKITYLDLI